MKSLADLKAELAQTQAAFSEQRAQDASLSSKQFSIKFKDGSTLFMQPEKMEKMGNLPVYNPEKYLAQHHPERLAEFRAIRAHNEHIIKSCLEQRKEVNRSPYESFFPNF